MKRTLLLDVDSFVYRMALGYQRAYEWTSELWTYTGDLSAAWLDMRGTIADLMTASGCQDLKVALSCTQGNYRKLVVPTYKGNRNQPRPMLFKPLRDRLKEEYGAEVIPWLEGDDLVSIWATAAPPGRTVVCSIDKDLETTPCLLYNPNKPQRGVVEIPAELAERNFLRQVLTGDRTDGYPGCPGMGPVRAEAVEDLGWDAVVAEYQAAGQSEIEALENARCARLLREGEYRYDGTAYVQLWHSEKWLKLPDVGVDTHAIGRNRRAQLG